MARRGENIYHRKDGRWEGRYIQKRKVDGKIKYGYLYGNSYIEVKEELIKRKAQLLSYKSSEKYYDGTVNDWLDYWLKIEVSEKRKDSTFDSYLSKINCHIRPILGDIPLDKLEVHHLQQFILKMEKRLSVASLHAVFRVLKTALKFAEKMGFISSSVYTDCQLPRAEKRKKAILTETQYQKLSHTVKEEKTALPVWIALETGLRIGEIAGLKWKDVDFENRTLSIRRTLQRISGPSRRKSRVVESSPKTPSSNRDIPLSDQLCVELQKRLLESQSIYILSDGTDCLEPRVIRNQFYKLLELLDMKRIPFHSLRHTFATRALSQGINISVISSLLGHASTKMTLDVYISSTKNEERKAIEQLALP